jgi:NAD(P)-dependent dehydrogenase (short-subunit alcohol dehydrogenase family)
VKDTETAELDGRVIVLVGGGGAIAGAAAVELGRYGGRLVLVDVDVEAANRNAMRTRETGADADIVAADALAYERISDLLTEVADRYGSLDVVIYLVGWAALRPSLTLDVEEFRKTLEINLTAQFCWAQAAAKIMRNQGSGSIVLMGSILGFGGTPLRAAYTASRGGLIQLVRTLAVEWAGHGIRVNAVAPGWVETDMFMQLGLPLDRYRRRIPMGRLGRPDDIAGAMRFFASPASRWVTGVTLPVDGGVVAYVGPGDPPDALL